MQRILTHLALVAALAGAPAALAGDADPRAALERGIYKEQAERRFEEAIAVYAGIVERHAAERPVVAEALLRMGRCHERLGDREAARAALERVRDRFADQPAAAEARRALARLEAGAAAPSGAGGAKDHADLRRALQEERVILNFSDAPIEEVLGFIMDVHGVPIVLDPHAAAEGHRVTIRVRDLSLENGLKLLTTISSSSAAPADELAFTLLSGAVYVGHAGRLDRYAEAAWADDDPAALDGAESRAVAESLRDRRVTIFFRETPLAEVLRFFSDISEVDVVTTPEAARAVEEATVTVRGRDLRMRDALRLALLPWGLSYRIEHGVLLIVRGGDG